MRANFAEQELLRRHPCTDSRFSLSVLTVSLVRIGRRLRDLIRGCMCGAAGHRSLLIGAVVAEAEEPHRLRRVTRVSRIGKDGRNPGMEGIFLSARSFTSHLQFSVFPDSLDDVFSCKRL